MKDVIAHQQFAHVEDFRAGIRGICGAYDVEPRRNGFHARAGLARRGALEIASVALGSGEVRRDARAIRRDDADHFVLILQRRGEAMMVQDEHRTLLRPGDMFLSDATRPSVFDFGGDFAEQLSIHLPRDEVTDRYGTMARGGLSIRREDSMAVAMTALVQRAQEDEPPEIAEAFLSLLGAWLQDASRGGMPQVSQRDGLLGRALVQIDLHFRDPEFGPGVLADLLNVAPRRLQRAFSPLGETPRERILSTRLDQAKQILERRGQRTVADVAYEQGFGDLSHFYSAFRSRFGHAPGATKADDA